MSQDKRSKAQKEFERSEYKRLKLILESPKTDPLQDHIDTQLLNILQKIEIFPHGVNYKPAMTELKELVHHRERIARLDELKQIDELDDPGVIQDNYEALSAIENHVENRLAELNKGDKPV